MKVVSRVGVLVALWLLAWGQITTANVLSGVAAAAVLLVVFPPLPRTDRRVRLRPVGVARLLGYVCAQLVTSNLVMSREVLRPRPITQQGVLAHRLHQPSEEVVTIMTSVIALSPGTMTADVDPASSTIYVHFLLLRDVDAARASLARLERLVTAALFNPGSQELP